MTGEQGTDSRQDDPERAEIVLTIQWKGTTTRRLVHEHLVRQAYYPTQLIAAEARELARIAGIPETANGWREARS